MKHIALLSLCLLALNPLAPLRADTDGRFLGRPITMDGKARPLAAPQVAPRPQAAPEPRLQVETLPTPTLPTLPPSPSALSPLPATGVEARSGCNMRLLKQMPTEVSYGQEFMYQLQAFATENVADIVVRDIVPEGAVYVRSEPPARVTGNVLEWTWSEMDAGQMREIRVWLRPEREGRLGSCATIHAVSRACAFTVVGRATLSLTKTGPATAAVGEDIPYNLTVSNSGNSVAKGVVVTDTVPNGLAHASGQSTLTFNIGDLAPNQSRSIPVVLRGASRGRYCNTATATSANAARASAEACTSIVQPGLQVTKTGPPEQFIGKNADYTITVMNSGDTLLSNVTVTDTAPQVARIIAATGATVAGTQAGWRIPELRPGERKSFTLTLTTAMAGTHANGVVAAAAGLTAQAQASTLWRGLGAMLVEVVDSPDPILVGSSTTYTIRITNQGSADLVNVNTVGTFPREISPTATQNGTVTGSTVRFQTIPRIGVGQSATFTVTGRGVAEGDGRVKFSFTEDSLSSPVVEEESTRVF